MAGAMLDIDSIHVHVILQSGVEEANHTSANACL